MNQEFLPGSCMRAFLAGASEPSDDEIERECASGLRLSKDTTPTEKQIQEWKALYEEAAELVYDYCFSLDRIDSGPTRSAYDHADDGDTTKQINNGAMVSGPYCLH